MPPRHPALPPAVALVALFLAGPAAAADSPLDRLPAGTPLTIQVRGWPRALDRLGAFFDAALPDAGGQLTGLISAQVEDLVGAERLRALPADSPALLAWLDLPGGTGPDPFVALISAPDPAAFRDRFLSAAERKTLRPAGNGVEKAELASGTVFLVDLDGWVGIALAEKTATRLRNPGGGLAARMPPGFADALLRPDAAVYLDVAAVKARFTTELLAARVALLGDLPAKGSPLLERMDRPDRAVLKRFLLAGVQAIEDGSAVVAGADFSPEGVRVAVRAHFPAKVRTGKLLAKLSTEAFPDLTELPAGRAFYLAGRLDDPVRQGMLALLQDAALTPGDNGPALKSDDTRAARTALDDWSAAGPARLRFAADFPGAAWSWVGGGDADRLRGAAAAYFAALPAGARVCGLPLAGPVRWDEQTHKGSASADLGRLGAKVPAEARNEFLTAQKRRLGPRIAAGLQPEEGGYTAVAGTAGTPPAGRLGDDEAYLLTRGRLPARPTLLALADAGRCSAGLAEYFRALFHGADLLPRGGLVPAKPYRGPASYLGAALRAEGDVLRVDLYLPADAVAAMRAVLEPLAADAGERP